MVPDLLPSVGDQIRTHQEVHSGSRAGGRGSTEGGGACVDDLPLTLTVTELAAALRCSRGLAYELVRSGAISSVRLGRAIRVPRAALLDFLERSVG